MRSHSPEETEALAQAFVKKLKPKTVIALRGDLGSGKTCFVRGLARGLGVPEGTMVVSPTFTLINEYPGRLPLFHLDLYRLRARHELEGLGLEEYFEGNGITVIEWADRFPDMLPERSLYVTLTIIDETTRDIVIGASC